MHTLLLGSLKVPSKHRKYIEYIQNLQNEGKAYDKKTVDEMIERMVELANDNEHIKEAYAKKLGVFHIARTHDEKLSEMITTLQQEISTVPETRIQIEQAKEHIATEYIDSAHSKHPLSLSAQLLRIREEFCALTAYTLSILLIIAEIEEVLDKNMQDVRMSVLSTNNK